MIVRNPKFQLLRELQAANRLLGCQATPTDAAIHRTRLHIKKARAVLRLLTQSQGTTRYKKVQHALQGANRILRRSRDYTVARDTLAALARRTMHMKPAVQAIEQSWRRHGDPLYAPLTPRDCRQARIELGRAAKFVRGGFSKQYRAEELFVALTRTYRDAHKAYRHAARTHSKRMWHECRKQSKCLYYQLVITEVSRGLPGTLRQAHLLESTLGRQRDLALLAREIRRRTVDTSAGASGVLLYLCNRCKRLQRRVDRYAATLYRTKPSAFAKRMRGQARAAAAHRHPPTTADG